MEHWTMLIHLAEYITMAPIRPLGQILVNGTMIRICPQCIVCSIRVVSK